MKLLILLAMAFAPAAFAAIPDSTMMTCQEVRDAVRRNGQLTMTLGGDKTYVIHDNFAFGSCGFSDDHEVQVMAPTLDLDRCNVGFICEDGDTLTPTWGALLIVE